MSKNQVIFFDIGQTLVTGREKSARRLLGDRLKLTEKETKRVGKLIMTHYAENPMHLLEPLETLLPHRQSSELLTALEAIWHDQIESVKEISGASLILKSLRRMGYRLGVISNIWHPFYEGLCRNCPAIIELLDYHLLSYREGCKKPSLGIFEQAIKRTGERDCLCWMVGDSYELDMEPAQRVGMKTLWVLNRPEKERSVLARILRSEKQAPDWVVENLYGILDFFQGKGL